jgi:O-antigen biosynthesis protein WbqP
MKRLFDFILALFLLLLLMVPMIIITIIIKLTSRGAVIHWSNRIGKNNVIFKMPKFRSMKIDTPDLASHLLKDPSSALSPVGSFLRKYSLDEIPQLWSILKGDMSFVGPRPALFNQNDLVNLRSTYGVDKILPGLTGWAQVNGRDDLLIIEKVNKDVEYLQKHSFLFDLKILWLTICKVIKKDGVSH